MAVSVMGGTCQRRWEHHGVKVWCNSGVVTFVWHLKDEDCESDMWLQNGVQWKCMEKIVETSKEIKLFFFNFHSKLWTEHIKWSHHDYKSVKTYLFFSKMIIFWISTWLFSLFFFYFFVCFLSSFFLLISLCAFFFVLNDLPLLYVISPPFFLRKIYLFYPFLLFYLFLFCIKSSLEQFLKDWLLSFIIKDECEMKQFDNGHILFLFLFFIIVKWRTWVVLRLINSFLLLSLFFCEKLRLSEINWFSFLLLLLSLFWMCK